MISKVLAMIGMFAGMVIITIGYFERDTVNMIWGGFLAVVNQLNLLLIARKD